MDLFISDLNTITCLKVAIEDNFSHNDDSLQQDQEDMSNLANVTSRTFMSKSYSLSGLSQLHIAIYIVSLFLGFIGNGLLIITSIFQRKNLSRPRFLIAHLAVTDVLFSLGLTVRIEQEINGKDWHYGLIFCKLFYAFNSMLMLASIGTMMVIAVERYRGIAKPYLAKIKRSTLVISLALVWFVSVVTYIPILLFRREIYGTCVEYHPDIKLTRVYSVVIVVVKYVIPLTVICSCYSRIASAVRNRLRLRQCLMQQQQQRKRDGDRIVRVLMVMVMAFALLTLPSTVWWLLVDFGGFKPNDAPMQLIDLFATCLYFHSWVNPIALYIMDTNFRGELRRTIKCQNEVNGSRFESADRKATPHGEVLQ